jgi:uncharacterized protein (TIGR00369 family)
MNDEHHRKLERMYAAAPINRLYEPRLTVTEGKTELVMPVKPEFFHAANAAHGSVYFKALDDAAFFAVSSLVEEVFVLTTSFNLYLVRPITEGTMTARGEVVHRTKSAFLAEAVLVDAGGQQIARGSGSFVRSQVRLGPDMGYV